MTGTAIDPKAGAKAARAIIAAHEAGMHDRSPKAEACRLCKKEIQEMAKEKTICPMCGGSFDGTPSGQAKHNATTKHMNAGRSGDYAKAQAVAQPVDETPDRTVVEMVRQSPEAVVEDFGRETGSLINGLSQLITSKEIALAARQVDHKWRVEHQPDKADAYEADKVTPLKVEIQLLRDVRKALGK